MPAHGWRKPSPCDRVTSWRSATTRRCSKMPLPPRNSSTSKVVRYCRGFSTRIRMRTGKASRHAAASPSPAFTPSPTSSTSSNARHRPHLPASGSCSCPWASRRTSTSASQSNWPTAAFQLGTTSTRSLPTTPSTFARCGAGGVAVRFRRLPTRWRSRAGVTCDTRAPHNVEIVKDARGDPTGVFLERNFVPVLEYTLFCDLPCFKYSDRVDSVRLGAHAYVAAGTTSLYEGHGLTPTVIRAYRENAERGALPLRMHTPISMPSAAFDDKRLLDLFYHYAGVAGGRGRGDDILRVEGINLGGHADSTVADIIAGGYPYDQWAGHFYQAMTQERFVKLGIEAARLGLRVNCVVSRDLEYALTAYEAIDKEVPIRDRRWVVIHVNQASDAQIRRMQALGVIATVVPGFLWMAGDRYGLDQLGEEAIPIRRMLDGGVPVALSTDGVPYSMLWTAWEAIARWDDDGQRQLGDSQLSREEAPRMAAQSGHRLTWNEDRYGSLEVGKVADMVVLAEDPLSCDLDQLKDIRVDRTFLGGRQVFGPT